MKCYKLPFKNIKDSDDFIKQFKSLLEYTKTDVKKFNLGIQESLF